MLQRPLLASSTARLLPCLYPSSSSTALGGNQPQVRHGSRSTKYLRRPWPRPYNRRMIDLALLPVLPEQLVRTTQAERCKLTQTDRHRQEHMDVDRELHQAHALHIRQQLANYRVMAVCQDLPGNEKNKESLKRKVRQHGIDLRTYDNELMRTVLEGTRLATLLPLFQGDCSNALMFGATPRTLKPIVDTLSSTSFLYLLG